jgi:hypothetical protein
VLHLLLLLLLQLMMIWFALQDFCFPFPSL